MWKLWPHFPDTSSKSEDIFESCDMVHTDAAIISGVSACWACAVELDLTDTTDVVFGKIPTPCGHRFPPRNLDLHIEWVLAALCRAQGLMCGSRLGSYLLFLLHHVDKRLKPRGNQDNAPSVPYRAHLA